MPPRPLLLAACLATALPLHAQTATTPATANPQTSTAATTTNPPANPADARFKAIWQREGEWRKHLDGGDLDEDSVSETLSAHLPDVSPRAQANKLAYWDDVLKQLATIDPRELSPAERINYLVYKPQIEHYAAEERFRDYEMPFNADSQFWSGLGFLTRRPMRTAQDVRNYIGLLRDVPHYFDQQIDNMRAGLARGFSVPRATLDGRDQSIAMVAELTDPEQSTFYEPLKKLPSGIPEAAQAQLRADAKAAIRDAVIPAFGKLLVFFRGEYLPKARTTLAAEAMPDGNAWYREQIRKYTTLDLSPDEIHAIGLKEVASIRAEMDAIIKQVGFKAPPGEDTYKAFLHFLRTDPRFYAKTPQELLNDAAWISKRVDGEVGKVIGKLPRGRFTIVPVPADIAPFWTAGRGGVGTYWLNTYNLPSRPLYNLPALTLHESSPGHSLQGALVQEMGEVPEFRKEYISAYGEGWGLYSEYLGKEMGIYQTPYEDFGRLTYAMWRACRLVIDTGVHHMGWTRDQALSYLRDNTALSEHEVTTEVDRYISWPGQALSYKLGELTIRRLRGEAEAALGPKFDLREFHDTVLAQGSVPMPVLELQVREWIKAVQARPQKTGMRN